MIGRSYGAVRVHLKGTESREKVRTEGREEKMRFGTNLRDAEAERSSLQTNDIHE
jgi:hypothetical protein